MPLVEVARLEDLPPGSSLEALVGIESFVICNHNGEIHALDGLCPHRNGPLGGGNFADGRVICPYHGWEFDCITGEYDRNPEVKLKKYPVHIEAGLIQIEVPESFLYENEPE